MIRNPCNLEISIMTVIRDPRKIMKLSIKYSTYLCPKKKNQQNLQKYKTSVSFVKKKKKQIIIMIEDPSTLVEVPDAPESHCTCQISSFLLQAAAVFRIGITAALKCIGLSPEGTKLGFNQRAVHA